VHDPHESDVFAVAVVVVAGDVGVGAVFDFAWGMGKAIPDGFAFAILVPGTFDLVGGGGGSPVEAFGESGGDGRAFTGAA
jgi:hypothetical protein